PAPRAQVRPRAGTAGHLRPGLHRGRARQAVLRRLPGRLPGARVPQLRRLPRVRGRLSVLPPADGRGVAGHVRRHLPAAGAHAGRHRGALGDLSPAHGRGAGPQRAAGVHERVRRGRGDGRAGRRGGWGLLHHQPEHGAGARRAGVRGGRGGRPGLAGRRHDRLAADRPAQFVLGWHRRQPGHLVRPVRRGRMGRTGGRPDDGEDLQPGGHPAVPADAAGAAGAAVRAEGRTGMKRGLSFALPALLVAGALALPYLLPAGQLVAAVQMLIAALFACAFNLLAGQAGMLSFGHAAYFGVGTFATIHAMNALGGAGLLPTPLMPLVGGAAGLLFGLAAGWFATLRSGVYFAMITLALAELLHALAPHLKGLFGGEAGVSGMRMPAWGFTFGSTIEVYYLVLVWVVACLAALYGLTRTPLGRLALGLRENTQRLRYLGYRPHTLKTLVFALSAMFSGVAGGLQALNIEAANYVLFEVKLSTDAVLFAYIGGVNAFLGP